MAIKQILKIGLAVTQGSRLLLVKKRGAPSYILPGGKPEFGEGDLDALCREIDEELGCRVDTASVEFLGSFTDRAADSVDTTVVTVRLYSADLVGHPRARSEIEALKWFSPDADSNAPLAPSLRNKILPFLLANGRLSPAMHIA